MQDHRLSAILTIAPELLASRGVIQPADDGKSYVCPHCNSGKNGRHGTGFNINLKDGIFLWNCFACGKGGNNIHLLAAHYGLDKQTQFKEILERAEEEFVGISAGTLPPMPKKTEDPEREKNLLIQIELDIQTARQHLNDIFKSNEFWRGLSRETMEYFGCGYLQRWRHPKTRDNPKIYPSARIIIPTSRQHYLATAVNPDKVKPEYRKMHCGKKEIFGVETLKAKCKFMLIVEGEVDCMTLWQATGGKMPVIATGSATSWQKTLETLRGRDSPKNIIIAFDGDQAGIDNAKKFVGKLRQCGYNATDRHFKAGQDANAILLAEGADALRERLRAMIKSTRTEG